MFKKGQTLSTDLVFAFAVFIVVLFFLFTVWDSTLNKFIENTDRNNMESLSLEITDRLARTQGIPIEWENDPSNTQNIGLVDRDRIIMHEKLVAFLNLEYNTTKRLLKTQGYEFYFELAGFTKGIFPRSEEIVLSKRFVVYNDNMEELNFYLWDLA